MRTRAAKKQGANLTLAPVSFPAIHTTTLNKKSKLESAVKRRTPATKNTKVKEVVKGEWDIIPHGIGKKGNVVAEDPFVKGGKVEAEDDLKSATLKKEATPEIPDSAAHKYLAPQKDLHEIYKDVTKNIEDHLNNETLPKLEKKKPNQYGLTPGATPFPDHVGPLAEKCEEVNRLLGELHGKVQQPQVIPAPSLLVAGCGEVPDPIDAILRTLLSATTRAMNSNLALSGLQKRYGLQETGKGKGSIKWNDVRKDDPQNIEIAIKSGGLAHVKANSLKKVTNQVYLDNLHRLEKLVKKKLATNDKGDTAAILDVEIVDLLENPLTLEWLYGMTTNNIMEYLTSLPGVGVKTAACVLLFNFKRPCFAVDTHVWRLTRWLGWIPPKATRDKAFSHLDFLIPDHLKYSLHQLFLRHGKSCFRCKGTTKPGSKEWEHTECPIDHLLNRTKETKSEGKSPKKPAVKTAGGKKRKRAKHNDEEDSDEESEESEASTDSSRSAKVPKLKKRKKSREEDESEYDE